MWPFGLNQGIYDVDRWMDDMKSSCCMATLYIRYGPHELFHDLQSPVVFFISFLNLYFAGNISSAGTQVWRQDAMFGTHHLPSEDGGDNNFTKEDVDLRYTYTPKSYRRIPWKSIALALFLLLLGTSLLFLSYFIFTGHMEGDSSQAYGLLFLGFLSFLPGMLF